MRSGLTDRLLDGLARVTSEIVEEDGIAGRQRRDQRLLDTGGNASPLIGCSNTIGAVMRSWRRAAMKVSVCHRPCGTLATSRSPRRVWVMLVFSGFVDEDEAARIEPMLVATPALPFPHHVWPVLLGGVQAFLNVRLACR